MTQDHDSFDSSLLEGTPSPEAEPQEPVFENPSMICETEIGQRRMKVRRRVNRKPSQKWLDPENPAIWEGSI